MDLDEDEGIVGDEVVHTTGKVLAREVVSTNAIVISDTTLNKDKHTIMRVRDEPSVQITKPRTGRFLPASIRGNTNKPPKKPVSILKELDSTESTYASGKKLQRQEVSVQWRENGAFDHQNGD
ncbi:hypothetical protein V6N13_130031 [Hibiscus sabdariffa]|uniref:Uncharacterized protein n=1 Tax=Hibiscus sabdariffa TaxID=183260 RepID=A0ABR2SMX4_9ROSI